MVAWVAISAAASAVAQGAKPLRFGDQSYQIRSVHEGPGTALANVEWKNFTAGSQAIEALQADALDAAILGDGPALFAASKGVPIKLLAVTSQSPEGVAVLVPPGSTAKSVSDLRGKKVAIWPGSWSQQLAYLALTREGIPLDAPEYVRLAPVDAASALIAGKIDAMSTWEPYVTRLEKAGARPLVNGKDLMKAPVFVLVRESVVRERPKDIEQLLIDLRRGYEWRLANPEKSAKTWAERSGVEQDIAVAWFTRARSSLGPITQDVIADLTKTADFLLTTGALRAKVDATALFDTRYTGVLK